MKHGTFESGLQRPLNRSGLGSVHSLDCFTACLYRHSLTKWEKLGIVSAILAVSSSRETDLIIRTESTSRALLFPHMSPKSFDLDQGEVVL